MLNIVTIVGRFTKDPELKTANKGDNSFSVVNFTLAIQQFSKMNKKEAMFLNFVAYSTIAERICKYCNKGDKIAVTGRLESNSYVDTDGTKRTKLQVRVETIEFMGKNDNNYSEFKGSVSDVPKESTSAASVDSPDTLEEFEKFLAE